MRISIKGHHFCEFCEKEERFPRVEFVDFPNNSVNVYEKRTHSLNVSKEYTVSEKVTDFAKKNEGHRYRKGYSL